MAKYFVVGANRGVGFHFTEQSLQKNNKVTAFIRNSTPELENLKEQYGELLTIVKGDVLNEDLSNLSKSMEGHDAVITSLGGSTIRHRKKIKKVKKKEYTLSKGTHNILNAMKEANIPKLCKVSSWGVKPEPRDGYFFTYFICWLLKYPLEDHRIADKEVMEFSAQFPAFDYTIVRPPGLTYGPVTTKITSGENLGSLSNAGQKLSRADVAYFILNDVLSADKYHNVGVAIGAAL